MSGVPGRSGGHNRLSIEEHQLRGTVRPSRHLSSAAAALAPVVSVSDRRRVFAGLSVAARLQAVQLLDTFEGWDAASLATLRAYVLSSERAEALQAAGDIKALHRELRINVGLLKALNLESGR
jgi:hypothetical protein